MMDQGPLIDTTLTRVEKGGFGCPLGAYPTDVSVFAPAPGYRADFEPADQDDDAEGWEEWPDRYVYDVVIGHARVKSLARVLFSLMPGRLYPILDVYGHDAYREIDPYIAYEPVGFERFVDGVSGCRDWLYEDGFVGFGAMSLDPFMHVYLDEHKIFTIRAESSMRERVERALAAFDLALVPEPMGVDSVEHEHRDVLRQPAGEGDEAPARDDLIQGLREHWRLTLNIDPDSNIDDEGNDLGATGWRCVVRRRTDGAGAEEIEALLVADCLSDAERLALSAKAPGQAADEADASAQADAGEQIATEAEIVSVDRVTPEEFAGLLGAGEAAGLLETHGVHAVRRLHG